MRRSRGWMGRRARTWSICMSWLRCELEYHAARPFPVFVSSAVEVACRIADHAGLGTPPTPPARKGVEHRLLSAGIQLIHHTRVGCAAAVLRGPVQVASRVADHAGHWLEPIRPAGEGVQYRLHSGGIQLVHYSPVSCTAEISGPVEAAGGVPDYTCTRTRALGPSETVQHCLLSSRIQLVHA